MLHAYVGECSLFMYGGGEKKTDNFGHISIKLINYNISINWRLNLTGNKKTNVEQLKSWLKF